MKKGEEKKKEILDTLSNLYSQVGADKEVIRGKILDTYKQIEGDKNNVNVLIVSLRKVIDDEVLFNGVKLNDAAIKDIVHLARLSRQLIDSRTGYGFMATRFW